MKFRSDNRQAYIKAQCLPVKGEWVMITLTRMNDTVYTLNSDLIEMVEETPDTVVTLVSGKKFVVKESREDIVALVCEYKRKISCF